MSTCVIDIVCVNEDAKREREASRLDDPRVRRFGGLGLDVGRHLRVGVDARIGRVAGLSLDLGSALRLGLESEGGADRPSGRRASRTALLAPVFPPPVLADLRAPALLALASPPPVLADARAPALLARASHPPVLADLRAPALLALASLPPVLAEGSSPRTPCTRVAASRARRSESPRTPCTCFAASRARRSESPRTPCSCVAPSRARRSESPRTPCTGASHPPVLADPFPRALLTVVSSVGLPVRAQRTSRSLRLPRARSLAETLRHGVVSPRGALWPRPRRTRGSDERFIFLGPIDASLAAPRTARFDHSPRFERALSVRRATPRTRSRRRGVDPARRIRPGAALRARRFASGGSSRSSARRVARSPRPRWWAVRRSNPPGCRARRTRRRTRGAWRGLARRTRTCPAAAAR